MYVIGGLVGDVPNGIECIFNVHVDLCFQYVDYIIITSAFTKKSHQKKRKSKKVNKAQPKTFQIDFL